MKPWERTFQLVREDLEKEAENEDGEISKIALERIICLNIGRDKRRTIPHAIEQLCLAEVIEEDPRVIAVLGKVHPILRPINQYSYHYLMDGFNGFAKKKTTITKLPTLSDEEKAILGVKQ
jgi:hypothetical protein